MSAAAEELVIGLVSISDRASQGVYQDEGIPALVEWFAKAVASPHMRTVTRLIPDERSAIEATLKELVDNEGCHLVLTTGGAVLERPATADEFLEILQTRVSASFVRSLNNSFMFGIHVFDDNEPFLIFFVNAYDQAFAGMLAWEPFLPDDLPLLVRQITVAEKTRAGTTTGAALANPTPLVFTDTVIKNRDVRALRDKDDNILMAYSFPDKNTLIIATNRNTLVEIFDRLAAARFR